MPRRVPEATASRTISPVFAYVRMFLATSEIAVAMRVRSVALKPTCAAISRPFWRAVTMSESCPMGTRISLDTAFPPRRRLLEQFQSLFQVERRLDPLEREAELDHGEGHVRLDADDHGLRAAQFYGMRNAPKRTGGKRIHDVQGGDVHHDATGTQFAHFVGQLVPEGHEFRIG